MLLKNSKIIVIKIGSSLLVDNTRKIRKKWLLSFAKDIKKTWTTINEVLGREKNKDCLPKYFISNGHILSDSFEIAQGFNDFFSNIGPELASHIPDSGRDFREFLSEEIKENFVFANITDEIIM